MDNARGSLQWTFPFLLVMSSFQFDGGDDDGGGGDDGGGDDDGGGETFISDYEEKIGKGIPRFQDW